MVVLTPLSALVSEGAMAHGGPRSRVTLNDVARLAGVSPTTASYILNDRSEAMRISADAQTRVRAAAAELAYQPNRSARSLRTATTMTIGLVSDHMASGQFASQMLSGANAAARECDHVLLIADSEGDSDLEARLVAELVARRVDGFVYATVTAQEVSIPEVLRREKLVLLNCFDPTSDVLAVMPDDYQGGREAAALVVRAGRAECVFVVGENPDPRDTAGPRRMRGLVDGLASGGSSLAGVVSCRWDVEAAFAAMDECLALGARPTAVVCLNDRIAMGAYQALAAHGLSVPDDVAVVSFDGSDLARWLRPPVTSIGLPFSELGAAAVRLLMGRQPEPTERTLLLPMPVCRGASLPPRRSATVDTLRVDY